MPSWTFLVGLSWNEKHRSLLASVAQAPSASLRLRYRLRASGIHLTSHAAPLALRLTLRLPVGSSRQRAPWINGFPAWNDGSAAPKKTGPAKTKTKDDHRPPVHKRQKKEGHRQILQTMSGRGKGEELR